MYKVIRGLDKIDWAKSTLLRTNTDFTSPAQGMRGTVQTKIYLYKTACSRLVASLQQACKSLA